MGISTDDGDIVFTPRGTAASITVSDLIAIREEMWPHVSTSLGSLDATTSRINHFLDMASQPDGARLRDAIEPALANLTDQIRNVSAQSQPVTADIADIANCAA